VKISTLVFCAVTLNGPVGICKHSCGTYWLHLQHFRSEDGGSIFLRNVTIHCYFCTFTSGQSTIGLSFACFFRKIYVMFRSSVIYAFVMWLHCLSYRCLKASVHSNKTTKVYFRWVCDYSLQERSKLGKGKTKIDRILTLNTHVRVQADYRGFMQISANKTSFYK
jgi:hypothetical protein